MIPCAVDGSAGKMDGHEQGRCHEADIESEARPQIDEEGRGLSEVHLGHDAICRSKFADDVSRNIRIACSEPHANEREFVRFGVGGARGINDSALDDRANDEGEAEGGYGWDNGRALHSIEAVTEYRVSGHVPRRIAAIQYT